MLNKKDGHIHFLNKHLSRVRKIIASTAYATPYMVKWLVETTEAIVKFHILELPSKQENKESNYMWQFINSSIHAKDYETCYEMLD